MNEIMGYDRRQLVNDDDDGDSQTRTAATARPPQGSSRCGCCSKHKRFWCFLAALSLILLGNGLAIYYTHFKAYWTCNPEDCVPFRVLSLNTWGMPASMGSMYKTERMAAIAKMLNKADYDLYLFEELWMRPDYNTLWYAVPDGYHITNYGDLTNGKCDGYIAPDGCSGLTIVSKYPIEEVQFYLYAYCGNPAESLHDGECLASKGVGRVRITPGNLTDVSVDVFVTHTVAAPPAGSDYNNTYYRVKQVRQLVDEFLKSSTADAIILGGDFNTGPDFTPGTPYQILHEYMANCVEDIYYLLRAWLGPQFATYANAHNTFSFGLQPPITYDYIFHRNQNKTKVHVWTNWFEMPFFKVDLPGANETISFSDHEAVTSSLNIKRLQP